MHIVIFHRESFPERQQCTCFNIVTCLSVTADGRRVFGLDIGFIDHLYTQLGTTGNYSAIADLRNLQLTTARAKFFQPAVSSPAVPW
jgi:hypothetical protein